MSVATQRTSSEKPNKKKTRIASLGGQDTIRVLNVYVELQLVALGDYQGPRTGYTPN